MTAPAPRSLVAPPWLARAGLVAALLAFLGLGLWQSRTFMVWSEEMIVHAMPAADVLEPEPGPDGQPRFEPSCAGPGAPLLVHSASRPTLNLCLGGRAFPILIAPYFAGYFYWPAALLAPLHHDEAFALRALGMLLGVASILVTFRVVRRFAGVGAAVLAALATAVMPCFLLVHATLEHFETLPWVWLMIAVDLFAGCPGLAPRSRADAPITPSTRDPLPTRRLVLAAFVLGLTIAANAKSVIVIAALAALALRLGVPLRRIRLGQWARMLAVLLVPLLPMIALSFAPEVGYSDKGTGWWRTLFAHLLDPSWLWSSLKALIFLWADIATYFGHLVVAPPLQVPALILASAALLFVLADTARTLIRGKGCPVTAAMGLCLLVYLGMVTLLYDHFPSNFTPLHTVYAVSLAMAAARLARVAVDRLQAAWPAVLVGALALLPFASSSASMIRAMGDVRVHTNTHAERALLVELEAHAAKEGEGTPIFTADVMMAGVIDSLSGGRIRTMRAHDFFSACQPRARNPQAPACIEERWRMLLPFAVKRSARFTAPADWSRWGSEHLSYVPGLEAAAARLGYRVTLERTFATARGEPALSLYRIDAPGVAAPGQTQAMPPGP
jgi:hypothetical protein